LVEVRVQKFRLFKSKNRSISNSTSISTFSRLFFELYWKYLFNYNSNFCFYNCRRAELGIHLGSHPLSESLSGWLSGWISNSTKDWSIFDSIYFAVISLSIRSWPIRLTFSIVWVILYDCSSIRYTTLESMIG